MSPTRLFARRPRPRTGRVGDNACHPPQARQSRAPGPLARFLALLALLASSPSASASVSASPADSIARGRQLYHQGLTADGQAVPASAGTADLPLPGAFAACVNCHGDDARGRTEAGRTVPDIRRETLERPHTPDRPGARRRPPYDAAAFLLALTEGVDAAGRKLDPAMPRYRLSAEAADDLLAYLQTTALRLEEGVDDDTIRVGFLLPPADAAPAVRERARLDRLALAAALDELNQNGGIHRRRIELVDYPASGSATATTDASVGTGALPATPAPVLLLLAGTHLPASTPPTSPRLPVLCLETAARAHAEVYSLFPDADARARALERHARAVGLGAPVRVPADLDDPALRAWRDAGRRAVILDPGQPAHARFGARARELGWRPTQLWLAAPPVDAIDADTPALVATPVAPATLPPDTLDEHARWAASHRLPADAPARRMALVATARLLGEALKISGRELSREKLHAALESINAFQSGLTPPLGFGAGRRTAIHGVFVLPLGKQPDAPPPVWIPTEG